MNDQKRRYDQAHLVLDLLGDWVLVKKAWGSVDSHRGNMRNTLVESQVEVF